MTRIILIYFVFEVIFLMVNFHPISLYAFGEDEEKYGLRSMRSVIDLRGQWKFLIGDDPKRLNPEFEDTFWEDIFVPSAWEDEGFPGYDGYAWYRKTFVLKDQHRGKNLYLRLGFIDDVDEVYFNGHFIGFTGGFPPEYYTGYFQERIYKIPDGSINFDGKNIIAVRVYDAELSGGIIRGKVGVYEMINDPPLDISLEGVWKFSPGDDGERKKFDFDDWNWTSVYVPSQWETQGFKHYDGYAWYRKNFYIPEKYYDEDLILILGKIDDLDETYLNGELVGKTGDMDALSLMVDEEWLELRVYPLKPSSLRVGKNNLLAVRVYDGLLQGGIYDGPVGIMIEKNYRKWRGDPRKKKGIFDFLFDN